MAATYPGYQKTSKKELQYNFISLYKTNNGIECEVAEQLHELEHNAIMDEFDQLYDREQDLLYGD